MCSPGAPLVGVLRVEFLHNREAFKFLARADFLGAILGDLLIGGTGIHPTPFYSKLEIAEHCVLRRARPPGH